MPMSRRPSLQSPFAPPVVEIYSDSRSHGPQGPARHVRIPQVTSHGGGAIAKSEDGLRCVVAGKDSLRILRVSEPGVSHSTDHKSSVGREGYRIDASRNLWNGSGLKIDSASTDVVWGHGNFSNKILTSARNGELIMWDLNKSGPTKFERRVRQHVRSIHQIAYSAILRDYCMTGSADGDIRVWDLRVLTDSVMKIRHPAAVRSVVFSPVQWQPRHAITGLENGNIYRWDLHMGQRGQLDRMPLAHSGPILALDWTLPPTFSSTSSGRMGGSIGPAQGNNWYSNVGSGLFDDISGNIPPTTRGEGAGMGWLASGGLDGCVKVWDMTPPSGDAHISRKALYTMHTSSPVRRVAWRPGYECELAVTSYHEGATAQSSQAFDSTTGGLGLSSSPRNSFISHLGAAEEAKDDDKLPAGFDGAGQPIEIWDVRRGFVAKWTVRGSAVEGGVTDVTFVNSHTLWAQHFSGTFSQLDLRYSMRTLDAIPRLAATWDPTGGLLFVADRPKRWEVPYDDINPEKRLKRRTKALGNKPYVPASQTMGIMTGHGLTEDLEIFANLAHGYVYEGDEKVAICTRNAEIAFHAGKHDAAQMWLVLASLLTDIAPQVINTPAITLSPLPIMNPKLPHSTSAPASIPTITHVAGPTNPVRAQSEDYRTAGKEYTSPGARSASGSLAQSRRGSEKSRTKSTSSAGTGFLSPLRTTPVSSTTPSPHKPSTPLPPLPGPLSASMFGRRGSSAGTPQTIGPMPPPPLRSRLASSYRRPSFKAAGSYNIGTEGESRSYSHSSLKHVGEGALDDSDSDSSGSEHHFPSSAVSETEIPFEGDEDLNAYVLPRRSRPSFSNASSSSNVHPWNSRASSVQPSPLSRVAVQESWTEDDREEDDSPSPASTDSEASSGGFEDHTPSAFMPPHPLSRRDSSNRARRNSMRASRKSRSRSSTVASLSVSLPPSANTQPRLIKHQESHSSIRTVTATPTPTSMHAPDRMHSGERENSSGLYRDATIRDLSGAAQSSIRSDAVSLRSNSYHPRSRPRSEAYSIDEFDFDRGIAGPSATTAATIASESLAREAILLTESRLRDAGWEAMRETVEILVDEGDVQMCAMLALVASKELRISKGRVLRFVENYIDMLTRLRLHGPAAYIRKHAPADTIRAKTETGTTFESVCARCRKPLLQPVPKVANTTKPSGSFAFCLKCKATTTKCAICHLPVRALAFTCPVCMHGGHLDCYQQYHSRRPPVLISSFAPVLSGIAEPSSGLLPNPAPRNHRRSESGLRGRASPVTKEDGSDDGTSVREAEEPAGGSRISEPNVEGGAVQVAIQGHPCAAGCGHHCWATNEVPHVAA